MHEKLSFSSTDLPASRVRHTDNPPLVSVVIPAFQAGPYVAEALDSVLAQTFTDYEIIVINDGSPDTAELEKVLEPHRAHIVYLTQENRGAASARNAGLRAARGRYIAFLDADDAWLPDYLDRQMSFIQGGSGYDFVYADALIVGHSPLAGRTYMETSPSTGKVTFESLVTQRCGVITSGVVASKQAILDAGLFDENLIRAHDYDLWLRMAKSGARANYQRRVLLRYRHHGDSLSGDAIIQAERDLIVLRKTARRNDLTAGEREALEQRLLERKSYLFLERGKLHLHQGDFVAAAQEIREANQHLGSWKLKLVLLFLRFTPRLLQHAHRLRLP